MKINKKLIIIIVIIVLALITVGIVFEKNLNEKNNVNINKTDMSMIEDYLNEKYNMNLKLKDYDYFDNGDIGIMAGKHYNFIFKPINGFELSAKLDYLSLEKENLNHLILNITNIEKASKLKEYVEKNSELKCKVTECRNVEGENSDYYHFKVELDDNSNYWIMGKVFNDSLDNSEISISTSLEKSYGLSSSNNMDFKNLLNDIKNK